MSLQIHGAPTAATERSTQKSPSSHRKKRQIGRIACAFCRARKARCIVYESVSSGDSATCKACFDQGIPCVFGERRGRGPAKRNKSVSPNSASKIKSENHNSISPESLKPDTGPFSSCSSSSASACAHDASDAGIKDQVKTPPLFQPILGSPVPVSVPASIPVSVPISQASSYVSPDIVKQSSDAFSVKEPSLGEEDETVAAASRILQKFSESVVMTSTYRSPVNFTPRSEEVSLPPASSLVSSVDFLTNTLGSSMLGKSFDLYSLFKRPLIPSLDTDLFCPRPLFELMIKIFLNQIYPVCPIVHRPSFVRDLEAHRERHDRDFFAFCIRLCGFVMATMPRYFPFYKKRFPELKFSDFRDMCRYSMDLSDAALGLGWINTGDPFLQWANTYLSALIGYYAQTDRSRTYLDAEGMAGIVKCHRWNHYPEAFKGQSMIGIELIKRAIFLTLFKVWNEKMFQETFSVANTNILGIVDPSPFIPVEVDDEYITETAILTPPVQSSVGRWPLITGFIANVRAFLCMENFKFGNPTMPALHIPICQGEEELATWKLFSTTDVVRANLPPPLAAWKDVHVPNFEGCFNETFTEQELASIGEKWYGDTPALYHAQMESARVNVHITLLSIQSLLLSKLEEMCRNKKLERPLAVQAEQEAQLWQHREEVCRNLIRIFGNISLQNVEANGLSVIIKVRSIAAAILNYPTELKGETLRRTEGYISHFMDLLMMLSNEGGANVQEVWLALNAQNRLRLSDLT